MKKRARKGSSEKSSAVIPTNKMYLTILVMAFMGLIFINAFSGYIFLQITGKILSISDWSGLNNNASFQGEVFNDGFLSSCPNCPQIVAGKHGSALKFGINDFISIPNDASTNFGTGNFTLSAWVMTTSATNGVIIETSTGADRYTAMKALRIENNGKNIGFYVRSSGGNPDLSVNVNLNDGAWHHVVGTYAANVRKLYFDGVLAGNDTSTIGNTDTASPWIIGSALDGTVDLTGSVDEVRVYNRALTQQEISDDMNSAHPISRPVASYSFEKIEDNKALDTHTIVKGKYGAAMSFDGNDDYVSIPDADLLEPSALTVESWARFDSIGASQRFIVSKRDPAGANKGYELNKHSDNFIYFGIDVGAPQGSAGSNSAVTANMWHHIVGTWDGTTVRLYIDGVQQSSTGTVIGSLSSTANLLIGRENAGNFLNGVLDEVKIYNRALTSQEIKESYQNNKVYPNNVLYLSFDNASKASPGVLIPPNATTPPNVSTAPDITVSNVTFLSTEAGNTRFDVTVENIGTATANGYTYNVDYGDGTSTGTVSRIIQLSPGQSETLIFGPSLYNSPGTYQLTVQVNTSGDSNITNNRLTRTVVISPSNRTNQTSATAPDITVSNVTFLSTEAGNTRFDVTVKNIGTATANGYTYNVDYGDGAYTGTVSRLVSLSPGQSETLIFGPSLYNSPGTYQLTVQVDTSGDSNITNNRLTRTVVISPSNRTNQTSFNVSTSYTTTSVARQIPIEDLIDYVIKLDSLKITYIQLRSRISALADYYVSVNDATNAYRYREAEKLFPELYSKIESLKDIIRTSTTETLAYNIQNGINALETTLNDIFNKLLA